MSVYSPVGHRATTRVDALLDDRSSLIVNELVITNRHIAIVGPSICGAMIGRHIAVVIIEHVVFKEEGVRTLHLNESARRAV